MRGLKHPESEKFENFFTLIQSKMSISNAVFFLDAGEGTNEFETDCMEGEDLIGWVIPQSMADEFEAKWLAGENLEEYESHYYHCECGGNPTRLKIRFIRCND